MVKKASSPLSESGLAVDPDVPLILYLTMNLNYIN